MIEITAGAATSSKLVSGSTLLGFYVGLFGPVYGVDIAVTLAGVWGAFFAFAASEKKPVPRKRATRPNSLKYKILRIVLAHTPAHRDGWRIIFQGGICAGLSAQVVAGFLAGKLGFGVYDILLMVAFLIGMLSDEIVPLLRRFLQKQSDK